MLRYDLPTVPRADSALDLNALLVVLSGKLVYGGVVEEETLRLDWMAGEVVLRNVKSRGRGCNGQQGGNGVSFHDGVARESQTGTSMLD
jgi:hypothetical protein